MKIYKNPSKDRWAEIIARPRLDLTKLNDTVATVLADVKARGDEAVKEYLRRFQPHQRGLAAELASEVRSLAAYILLICHFIYATKKK